MTLPDKLAPELLYLFVLGPGYGESILLRVPPDKWIVVDSFVNNDFPAAQDLLDNYDGDLAAVVVTHPHEDHYPGIIELLDENPFEKIGAVHPERAETTSGVTVNPLKMLRNKAKNTYDRVWYEWGKDTTKKWWTFRNSNYSVCNASLTSLHPNQPTTANEWSGTDPNEISSALFVEWESVRLLLGADVTTSWPEIKVQFPDISKHIAMKVPHHGTEKADYSVFASAARDRVWIATPYSKNKGLPQAKSGHGLDKILKIVDSVHLTSLPYSHDRENEAPCSTTRAEIETDTKPAFQGPPSTEPHERAERYIVVSFDADGNLVDRIYGKGTLTVS